MNMNDMKTKIETGNIILVGYDIGGLQAEWVSFVKIPGIDFAVMDNWYMACDTHPAHDPPHAYIASDPLSPWALLPSGQFTDLHWTWTVPTEWSLVLTDDE